MSNSGTAFMRTNSLRSYKTFVRDEWGVDAVISSEMTVGAEKMLNKNQMIIFLVANGQNYF